jgi:S1-C subfamily serine protease
MSDFGFGVNWRRAVFFLLFPGFFSSEPAFADFVQIVARAKPAIVQLEVQTEHGFKSGTGFFISPNGYLVTNAHVIAGALNENDFVATATDGTHYFVERIAYVDQNADIAIVKFDCSGIAYLEPDLYDDVAEGQTVLVIGNPEGLQGTVSNGLVAAIRKDLDLIQITAPISHGSSGSPVLNEDGRVIGVAVGIWKEGQNLNFAIPVKEVRKGMLTISKLSADLSAKRTLQPQKPKAPHAQPGSAPDYSGAKWPDDHMLIHAEHFMRTHIINIAPADTLTLRSGPGTNFPPVTEIPPNDTGIVVFDQDGNWDGDTLWFPVEWHGFRGYVGQRYLPIRR